VAPKPADSEIRGAVASVLADHPVAVGFLFGSLARDDVDVVDLWSAVAFCSIPPELPV